MVQDVTVASEPLSGPASAHGPGRDPTASPIRVSIAVFAALQLGLALLMAVSPHDFYTAVGPFGNYNGHYIRDLSTFYAATGVGLLVSLRHVSWRVPMLALMTIQYGLHSLNHLLDIGNAHPAWNGYFDFVSLTVATVVLAWLWRRAALQARA